MSDYSTYLGESIYKNRKRRRMTQAELAEKAGVTEQTIRKIEHGDGNPQLDVLCSLITALDIDLTEIVYPQKNTANPAKKQLDILLHDCSEEDIEVLLPICEAAINALKARKKIAIR